MTDSTVFIWPPVTVNVGEDGYPKEKKATDTAGGGFSFGAAKPGSGGTKRTLSHVNTHFYVGSEDGEIVFVDWMPQKDQDSGKIQSECSSCTQGCNCLYWMLKLLYYGSTTAWVCAKLELEVWGGGKREVLLGFCYGERRWSLLLYVQCCYSHSIYFIVNEGSQC